MKLILAFIAQLGEHCNGFVGSNPAQSLNFFSGLCSSSVTAVLALMTVNTQLLLMDKLISLRGKLRISEVVNLSETIGYVAFVA